MVKLIRNGLVVVVAVGAAMVLSATVVHAALSAVKVTALNSSGN